MSALNQFTEEYGLFSDELTGFLAIDKKADRITRLSLVGGEEPGKNGTPLSGKKSGSQLYNHPLLRNKSLLYS